MTSKNDIKWIIPVDTQYPENNVWVMISKGKDSQDKPVQSIRVFSEEPHESTVDYECQQFTATYHDVEVAILEVALDYFDAGESGFHPC